MLGVYTIVEPGGRPRLGLRRTLALGAVSVALLVRVRRARGDGGAIR